MLLLAHSWSQTLSLSIKFNIDWGNPAGYVKMAIWDFKASSCWGKHLLTRKNFRMQVRFSG